MLDEQLYFSVFAAVQLLSNYMVLCINSELCGFVCSLKVLRAVCDSIMLCLTVSV